MVLPFFITFTIFAIWYLFLVIGYFWHWLKAHKYTIPAIDASLQLPHVAVVIPFRNEAANLSRLLEGLRLQAFPQSKLNIYLINDHSTDLTYAQMQRLEAVNVSVCHAPDVISGKKACLQWLIPDINGEIIVTTDADCYHEKDWLMHMVFPFLNVKTQFVSGPVVLTPTKSVFEVMQQLEFASLVAIGCASITAKKPTMCNGANLAYRKSAFLKAGGYQGNLHIASGDDEHLMHRITKLFPDGVTFCLAKAATVQTRPQTTLKAFWHQRKRWVSKSTVYEEKRITLTLMMAYCFYAQLLIGTCLAAGMGGAWAYLVMVVWVAKVAVEGVFLWHVCGFFGIKNSMRWFLPEQVVHLFYVLVIGIGGNLGSYQWKNRSVKSNKYGRLGS